MHSAQSVCWRTRVCVGEPWACVPDCSRLFPFPFVPVCSRSARPPVPVLLLLGLCCCCSARLFPFVPVPPVCSRYHIIRTCLTPVQGNLEVTEHPGFSDDPPPTFLKNNGTAYGHIPGARHNDFSRRSPWYGSFLPP